MKTTLFFICILFSQITLAQNKYAADTDSIHHICDISLEIISVKKGETVNWDRFMNLFLPEGVMIWTGSKNDTALARTIPVEKMRNYDGYTESGFNEKVLKRIT